MRKVELTEAEIEILVRALELSHDWSELHDDCEDEEAWADRHNRIIALLEKIA